MTTTTTTMTTPTRIGITARPTIPPVPPNGRWDPEGWDPSTEHHHPFPQRTNTRATHTWREPETRPQKQSHPTDQPVKSIVQEIVIPRRRKGYTYHTILFLSSNFNRPLYRVLSDEPPPPQIRDGWWYEYPRLIHSIMDPHVCACVFLCVFKNESSPIPPWNAYIFF